MNKALCALLACLVCGSATANTLCRFVSGSSIAFGDYDALSATPNDTLATVVVTCERNGGPQNVTVTLGLSQGLNGPSVNNRRMARGGGGAWIDYGLYRNVARTSPWGVTNGVDTMALPLSVPNNGSASGTFTIYGRTPAGQNPPVGSYSDSIQMTLTP